MPHTKEMLSHQTQADKDPRPDSPRPAHKISPLPLCLHLHARSAGPGPVHRLLYEDAMRRAARREVHT